MKWHPPLDPMPEIPEEGHPGSFGIARKFDIHTGVDLYANEGSEVRAVESGFIVAIVPFTGPEAESPWWLSTEAVLVEGLSGVVLYGEITPDSNIRVGDEIAAGGTIGKIKRVLRHDKGTPTCMLHLELYTWGVRDGIWWKAGHKPPQLLDPTPRLIKLKTGEL